MKRGFTLLEMLVVIIIIGILASLGTGQYSKTVEKSRGAEAKRILGYMRELAADYFVDHDGNLTGLNNAYFGIGNNPGDIPGEAVRTNFPTAPCQTTHYFKYEFNNLPIGSDQAFLNAMRCTSGGKSPNMPPRNPWSYLLWLNCNFTTNKCTWGSSDGGEIYGSEEIY